MLKHLLAAALMLSAVTAVRADDKCLSVDEGLAFMEKMGGTNFRFLDGKEREKASEVYNKAPPVSEGAYSIVVLVDGPAGAGAILTGNDGKLCGQSMFLAERWRAAMAAIFGDDV